MRSVMGTRKVKSDCCIMILRPHWPINIHLSGKRMGIFEGYLGFSESVRWH